MYELFKYYLRLIFIHTFVKTAPTCIMYSEAMDVDNIDMLDNTDIPTSPCLYLCSIMTYIMESCFLLLKLTAIMGVNDAINHKHSYL